jgi:hypothetical protein
MSVPTEDSGQQKSPEELREEINETRQDLGETVEALAEKADVKAQASWQRPRTPRRIQLAPDCSRSHPLCRVSRCRSQLPARSSQECCSGDGWAADR